MSVRIGTSVDGVAIECARVDTASAQPSGDLLLLVSVRTGEFSGRTDAWIEQPKWLAFMRELNSLETTRKGSATLEGISPGELRLTLRATDRAGHMAIDGLVGVRSGVREIRVEFSPIEFDPGDLANILRQLSQFAPAQACKHPTSREP